MNDEFRRANRRRIDQEVQVQDTVVEEVIGKLVNLSETGMSMMANRRVVNDALYQLHFELPGRDGVAIPVDVGCHELWATDAAADGQAWVGFRFIAVSSAHREAIRKWVGAPGAEYVDQRAEPRLFRP